MSHFNPTQKTILGIRQQGASQGDIVDALSAFQASDLPKNDESFERYCFSLQGPSKQALFPAPWSPSRALNHAAPIDVVEGYLQDYNQQYAGGFIPSADLELHFQSYCDIRWQNDCRNPSISVATVLRNDWTPSATVLNELKEAGLPMDYIELLILEFRLYWCERGEKRFAWHEKFKKNAVFRYKRKVENQLAY